MPLKITSALFTACAVSSEGLPDDGKPVIALVGRSNVGKSSLINIIANRKELARTSSLPGKTLTINYYNFNDEFYIVDLPGYGYAKASKVTRQRIQAMMNDFFSICPNLKGIIQILDARHKPGKLDRQMYNWLREQKFNYLSVITKIDKLSNQQTIKMRKAILKEMGLNYALLFSAKNQTGKEEFLDAIEKILAGYQFKVAEKPARKADKNRSRKKSEGKNAGSEKSTKKGEKRKKTDKKSSAGTGRKRRRRPAKNNRRPDKSEDKTKA
ncbi:MAG: ribosome biogenesis GTP-binding protein YihA/YsxC [Candidatus Rifleibacteriota bacterium]